MGRFLPGTPGTLLLSAVISLTACSADNGPAAERGAASATPGGVVTAQATPQDDVDAVYTLDADSSEIYWLIYRAGAAARFGHNHVISVGELNGRVHRAADLAESRFELEIPVAGLVVDDPEIRSRHGEDFTAAPSQQDIDGTRENMLGEDLLNAASHPTLRVSGTGPREQNGSMLLDLEVDIVGRTVPVSVPVTFQIDGEHLEASGEFRLTHADLGLMPFSAMLGALRVAEEMDFSYRIVARRVDDAR